MVSRELLYREHFIPARSLNLLAASWIQFQVHDWVNHARHPLGKDDIKIPVPEGMKWSNTPGGPPEPEMRISGNVPFPDERPHPVNPVFANSASHWWDGSEVYGTDAAQAMALREGAKLRLTPEGYLPEDTSGQEMTGFNESWWLGLGSLHTIFAREHNLLCDELRAHYRGWSDERVYQTARLIVSALIAKIHTVEWTPAILGTEVIDVGLKSNWNGPPSNDWLTKLGIWLVDSHSAVGIPKTKPDHHAAPYSLTEDFATVYRMHPLLPDDYRFVDHANGELLGHRGFLDIQGVRADEELRGFGLDNALYSFGVAHPGAITLHNFPRALQQFEREGEIIDLSVVDLVRTRRRGVPRYNDFRTGLHRPRVRSWSELSENEETVRRLREVYRSIDEVDTVVGLFAETPPTGFGFSDTAFRIFILMASRRLQSDRFLTVDFRPEVYSPFGMDWIEKNGMTSVILRHCPELAAVLPRGANAFAPWRPVVPTNGGRPGHDHAARRRCRDRSGRAPAAVVAVLDLGAAYAPGQQGQLRRGRVAELDVERATHAAHRPRGGGADLPDRVHRPDHARPPAGRPAGRQADHGQAEPHHARPHRRQPRQRPGHALLPDQRHRDLLPAQAATSGGGAGVGVRRGRRCSPAPRSPRSSCSTTASTSATATGTSPPTWTPTGSCPTSRAPRSCSRSSTCPGSTSTG